MKLLLTGGRGFIGSYFQKAYSEKYEIERFSFRKDNLQELSLKNIEVVVHLAALVHQMGGASKEEYYRINYSNTLSLAKKVKSSGVKQFIFMSSVKVYGEESEEAYSEKSPCHPQDDYGKSKLAAEEALLALEDESFRVAIIRTPIVYGAGVKANILSLVNLIQKVPVLPLGNIKNRRSMVYIGNLCAIIHQIIATKNSGIFLAADDEALSTSQFVELIAKALEKKIALISLPLFAKAVRKIRPAFYKRLYLSLEVDNSLTKERLVFSNPYTTKEGIVAMIKGIKK